MIVVYNHFYFNTFLDETGLVLVLLCLRQCVDKFILICACITMQLNSLQKSLVLSSELYSKYPATESGPLSII